MRGGWPDRRYWGGAGEQIDLLSGNLNYTVPLLKAMSRTGWGAGFSMYSRTGGSTRAARRISRNLDIEELASRIAEPNQRPWR
jgi:hypothetical protein